MADTMTKEQRSGVMRAVKSSGTKPERLLAAAIAAIGAGWSVSANAALPGKPDFAIVASSKLAVFVHGCFWHCCPRHFKPVDGGRHAGWKDKFAKNVRRDRRVRRRLNALGWRTAVVWEHDLKTDEQAAKAAKRILMRLAL